MPPALSTRSAASRLVKELDTWRTESAEEKGIERLGPLDDDDLLVWQAVINGRGINGGYDGGRWLLEIKIPPAYPRSPPEMRFATPVAHANVDARTGKICLDLLADAWTPTYTVLECVRAVRDLLAYPAPDSPLNVDLAALLNDGDILAARRLVEFRISDEGGRYEGS